MTEQTRLPDREPTMRVPAMPTDTNAVGDIFGGWIMSQVDIAGSVAAIRHVGKRVVTVAVNALHFKKPVYVGDLVSCYAQVERVGRTSITVSVDVYAERLRDELEVIRVTEATLTYVVVDKNGQPVPARPEAENI